MSHYSPSFFLFFFNDTATTEIYTLSLHDALPISWPMPFVLFNKSASMTITAGLVWDVLSALSTKNLPLGVSKPLRDRKSTRLNSSHQIISYAVFCLKKKKKKQ